MIGGLLLGSAVVCHAVALEVIVLAVEWVAAFAVEWAAASAVEQSAASDVEWAAAFAVKWTTAVAWASVASAAGCHVHVAWTGVKMFTAVNAAAGLASAAESVLSV